MNDADFAFEGAFREGESAAGASAVRDGFTFAHGTDVAFALGFPHARVWSRDDVPVDVEAVIRAPRWVVHWPPSIGRARARVRGVDNVWIDENGKVTPEAADVAVRTTTPLSVDDARRLVERGLARTQPFGQLDMCLLLEADLGASTMLNIIADALDRLPVDALTAFAVDRSTFAQFVGFALLRVPASEAPSLRERFEAVVRRAPVERQPYTISGVLNRALHGRAGAERNGSSEGPGLHPSSLWFVDDDPSFVRDQLLANDEPYERFTGDARCAFLGGPEVVHYYVKRWFGVDLTMSHVMLNEFGQIRDPLIVQLMVMAGDEPELEATANAWFDERRAYARPILESLAAGTRKKMSEAAAVRLAQLG